MALILRDTKIVLTCRPRSGAFPGGSACGASSRTTRSRDADGISPRPDRAGADAIGAAATTCTQQGAASVAGESPPPGASGWALPPTAKSTAAGPPTAVITSGDFRRRLGNECRPTRAPHEQIKETSRKCNYIFLTARFGHPLHRPATGHGCKTKSGRPRQLPSVPERYRVEKQCDIAPPAIARRIHRPEHAVQHDDETR